MDIFETLREMNAAFGPSGQENGVAEVIAKLAKPYVDQVTTDVMGNLICHRKGSGAKVMFAAHMDSLGFMVTHITDEGFLRVGALGGISAGEAFATPVRFANGTLGVVYEDDELGDKKREMGHIFLDIGARSKEEAMKRAQVGDVAIYNTPTFQTGNSIVSPYLDNRICCAALLKAMELTKQSDNDLYFVFTVQEEVGLRGAKPAAYAIDPDYAVVTDVTVADDLPGSKHTCSSRCGGGAAIKVMDKDVICHPEMVKILRDLAESGKISYQMDVISAGGTDGGPIHKSRAGVATGGVSVPCRCIHSAQEMVYLSDVEDTAKLLAAFAGKKLEKSGV